MQPSVEYTSEALEGAIISPQQQIRLTVAVALISALGSESVTVYVDALPEAIRKISDAIEQ